MDELKDIIMKMKGLKIAVIGDAVLDRDINCKRERLNPDKKRVPLLRVSMTDKKNSKNIPGQGANVASNIAPFSDCDFYGIVGEDFEGREIERTLKEKRINPKIIFSQEIKTIVKNRFYDDEGEYSFRLDEEEGKPIEISNNLQERLLEILRMEIKNYNAIVLSDYNKGFLIEPLVRIIIKKYKGKVPIIVDPKNNIEKYKDADILKPNEKELNFFEQKHGDVWDIRNKFNFKYVLVTRGSKGYSLYYLIHKPVGGAEVIDKPIYDSSIVLVDITGAGDTFTATLGVALASGFDIKEAADLANFASGLTVQYVGCYAPLLSEFYKYK